MRTCSLGAPRQNPNAAQQMYSYFGDTTLVCLPLAGGRSSARLEPQIVDLAVAGSNPVDHPTFAGLVITHIFSPAILPPLLGTRERIPERQHWDGTAGLFETPTASRIPGQRPGFLGRSPC